MFGLSLSRIFSVWVLLGAISYAEAKTLIIPYPGLVEQEGLLQPSVLLGKPGFTLEGLSGSARLPARLSVAGAFPMFSQDTLRGSGWMWAVRAGVTEMLFAENRVFAAGHYYVEAGLGRGTTAPLFEDRSGLRGYMEVSLRTERPRISARMNEIAQTLNADVRDKKTFLSIKVGAGSSLDAEGLVRQKPGVWGNRVQSQIYLPTTDHGGTIFNFVVEGYRLCGSQSWLCGWHFSYQHHGDLKNKTVRNDDLSDLVGSGVFVNYYAPDDYNIGTRVTWPFIANASQRGFDAVPMLHLLMTKKF